VKLPLELARSRLLRRGAILKTTWDFGALSKPKYLVVVSLAQEVDPVFLVMTTSKVAAYKGRPWAHVSIAGGTIQAFPVETVIDCRKLHTLLRDHVLDSYEAGKLEYCGELPGGLLEQVTAALAASITLSDEEKRMVVPAE
jgi:hypothetical protein